MPCEKASKDGGESWAKEGVGGEERKRRPGMKETRYRINPI